MKNSGPSLGRNRLWRWLSLSLATHVAVALALWASVRERTSEPVRVETEIELAAGRAQRRRVQALARTDKAVRLAPQNDELSAPASSSGSFGSAAVAGERERYLGDVRARIELHKHYPMQARSMRQQGAVEVSFRISASGEITGVNLLKASSFEALNRAALDAVRQANPVPAPPSGLDPEDLEVIVTLNFRLN